MNPSLPILFLALMLTSIPTLLSAQSNSLDSSFQKQFNTFNTDIQKEFNTFRQNNDSLFLQFLAQSWKEINGMQNKIPTLPEPKNPPTYKAPETPVAPKSPKADSVSPQPEPQPKVLPSPPPQITPDTLQQPVPIAPELPDAVEPLPIKTDTIPNHAVMELSVPSIKIEYYGTNFNLPTYSQGLPLLSSLSKQGIIAYFADASASSILNSTVKALKKEADECRLNNWGLANLFLKASEKIFPDINNRVLFTWFAMLRSGFNVKVGYNNSSIYLLLPSNENLYETSYTIKGKQYYFLNFGLGQAKPEHLNIHEADYPQGITSLSFMITQTPELTNLFTARTLSANPSLVLKLNKNLIDFYNNYPQCELKVFFTAPLSANAIRQLDAYFLPALDNKKEDEKVTFLLKFIHQSIRYKTDGDQFGHEKYFFADETLYFPFADCEDRSVLLAKLINRYTSCKVIGLSYPTHVSLAVNMPSLQNGKYLTYNNLHYYHCDPTYIGASFGMPMPDFENTTPVIIDYMP
ncbi:MAG: hypothetical protein ACOYN4_01820 [Bacteroidales bacterium]